ncbi:uncharacterized protein VTP21DRAFT_24 [Calcarisporiella thermophila]|uniref:uncharacterized protein n=1 Tax=Calcarisporiella thermophila TaxID=911321 RepID=UPI0037444A1D
MKEHQLTAIQTWDLLHNVSNLIRECDRSVSQKRKNIYSIGEYTRSVKERIRERDGLFQAESNMVMLSLREQQHLSLATQLTSAIETNDIRIAEKLRDIEAIREEEMALQNEIKQFISKPCSVRAPLQYTQQDNTLAIVLLLTILLLPFL